MCYSFFNRKNLWKHKETEETHKNKIAFRNAVSARQFIMQIEQGLVPRCFTEWFKMYLFIGMKFLNVWLMYSCFSYTRGSEQNGEVWSFVLWNMYDWTAFVQELWKAPHWQSWSHGHSCTIPRGSTCELKSRRKLFPPVDSCISLVILTGKTYRRLYFSSGVLIHIFTLCTVFSWIQNANSVSSFLRDTALIDC